MNTIFVQIASYRDPELVPTIKDMLSKAKYPKNLRFGIAWQHSEEDEWDNLDEFKSDPRFKILDIDYQNSQGACWARSLTQMLYNNETYTLQIDSHSRFIDNWDVVLIDTWKLLNDDMAILTGYPPNYSPMLSIEKWDHSPQICNVYEFNNGIQVARPKTVPNFDKLSYPVKAIHISAGFIFGTGDINKKILYDPNLYFTGEEANLSLRYFTHGYNLYHPHILILHHFYTRSDHRKHWIDHKDWGKLTNTANTRLNALVGKNKDVDLKVFGLGNKRTLEDYKYYAGIDYQNYLIHEDAINGNEPPCSNSAIGWERKSELFSKTITWDYSLVPKCDDPRFWAVFVCDQNKNALHRIDVEYSKNPEIIEGIVDKLFFKFKYNPVRETPTFILIWPYSESNKWIENIYLPLETI